ncbi:MAG: phosphohistidine phosphatase SixA [Actinomycetota bacterium]|nr:phosphohistidine phosphatase SixA [Actinomycetota bacterium]
MQLYLVRHAEAESGEPDEERRLTQAGREQARALGRRLAEEGVSADALLTSPLVRARETAAALGAALGIEPEPDERLRPGATSQGVREAVRARGERVVVVAHQPDCGLIAGELAATDPPPFPPAGVVRVELDA